MGVHAVFSVIANLGLIALLIAYGLMFFAEYHARGRWAKNVTSPAWPTPSCQEFCWAPAALCC